MGKEMRVGKEDFQVVELAELLISALLDRGIWGPHQSN